jgi:competence protein ComEC
MVLPKLTILDVGHGNSAVLHDHEGTLVFDAGPRSTLATYLAENKIYEIDALLISHSDADHLGGAINLLCAPEFYVKAIYLNADAQNAGDTFEMFRVAVRDAREKRNTQVHSQLNTTLTGTFRTGSTVVEVLAPTPEDALGGPGSRDLRGKRINSNSMSAVIRLSVGGEPIALLPGDLDAVGLANMIGHSHSLRARILVFPHHGGRPGRADAAEFTRELCNRVLPELIIFSIGRGKHNTPNPAIVDAIMDQLTEVRIACTQLSEACSMEAPGRNPDHLSNQVASGKESRKCCLGTLEVTLSHSLATLPILSEHQQFVQSSVPSALCRKRERSGPTRAHSPGTSQEKP